MAAAEKRVSLYWNCANSLKPETHTHKLLKSYYMNMCRKFARNSIQIPKEKFATTQMCSYCGCFWNESEFKLKLKSQHLSLKGKTRKLVEALSQEAGPHALQLSGKQRKRAKWLQKRTTRNMEIKCEQCQHKSLIKMEKPKNIQKNKGEEVTMEKLVVIENDSKVKAKKKKKTKNKLAGLKLPLDVKPEIQNVNKHKTPPKPPPPKQSTKCPAITQRNKTTKKKKSTTATTTPSNSSTNKGVSKTQQQNSILQLAALLKQSSSVAADGKSSAQKRLESLLK